MDEHVQSDHRQQVIGSLKLLRMEVASLRRLIFSSNRQLIAVFHDNIDFIEALTECSRNKTYLKADEIPSYIQKSNAKINLILAQIHTQHLSLTDSLLMMQYFRDRL